MKKILNTLDSWILAGKTLLHLRAGDSLNRIGDAEKRWITTESGSHIQLDENGTIIAGAGGKFNGKNIKEMGGTKKFTKYQTNAERAKPVAEQAKINLAEEFNKKALKGLELKKKKTTPTKPKQPKPELKSEPKINFTPEQEAKLSKAKKFISGGFHIPHEDNPSSFNSARHSFFTNAYKTALETGNFEELDKRMKPLLAKEAQLKKDDPLTGLKALAEQYGTLPAPAKPASNKTSLTQTEQDDKKWHSLRHEEKVKMLIDKLGMNKKEAGKMANYALASPFRGKSTDLDSPAKSESKPRLDYQVKIDVSSYSQKLQNHDQEIKKAARSISSRYDTTSQGNKIHVYNEVTGTEQGVIELNLNMAGDVVPAITVFDESRRNDLNKITGAVIDKLKDKAVASYENTTAQGRYDKFTREN